VRDLGPFFYRANYVRRHWPDPMFRQILIEHSQSGK